MRLNVQKNLSQRLGKVACLLTWASYILLFLADSCSPSNFSSKSILLHGSIHSGPFHVPFSLDPNLPNRLDYSSSSPLSGSHERLCSAPSVPLPEALQHFHSPNVNREHAQLPPRPAFPPPSPIAMEIDRILQKAQQSYPQHASQDFNHFMSPPFYNLGVFVGDQTSHGLMTSRPPSPPIPISMSSHQSQGEMSDLCMQIPSSMDQNSASRAQELRQALLARRLGQPGPGLAHSIPGAHYNHLMNSAFNPAMMSSADMHSYGNPSHFIDYQGAEEYMDNGPVQ